jgi:ABC-type transport system involved in Fe-S cluster assembly fused permease/ATPase subunit
MHADYARSIGRWYRNFFAILVPFLLALILAEYLWISFGGLYAVVAGVTFLLFLAFCVYEIDYLFRRTSRRYARDWKDRHPAQ